MKKTGAALGATLRKAREQRGLSARDISNTTKISVNALQAIERGDLDRLPGGVFRRAYIQSVADGVGLNAAEIVDEYRELLEPPASASSEAGSGKRVAHPSVLAIVVALVLAILAWTVLGAAVITP